MKTLLGFLFIIVSFIGSIFFKSYNGNVIPYPLLWYMAFLILGFLGALLIYNRFRRSSKTIEQVVNTGLDKFKSTAEIIELDFDKCEFKSGSYSHIVKDENMEVIKHFAPGSLRSIDITVTENVIQSYLIFTDIINGDECKFISHAFAFDQTTLKFYVLNHKVALYVDRFNPKKYHFELTSNDT